MYKKFKELSDVFSFSLNDGCLAYCNMSGKVAVVDSSSLEEVWATDIKNASQIIWYGDILYVRDSTGHGANYFFTKKGELIKEDGKEGLVYAINLSSNMVPETIVCNAVIVDGKRKFGLLNIKRHEFLWIQDIGANVTMSFQTTDFVIVKLFSKEQLIACLSSKDGQLLWQLNLLNLLSRPDSIYLGETNYEFRVVSLIAVYANRLIISVSWDPVSNRLLSINCDTGSVEQYWPELRLKTANHAHQILDGSRVLYLHGYNKFENDTQYAEINLLTGNIERTGIVESLLQQELVLTDWTFKDGKIYFTAIKNERFPTHIGVLDYNSLDLLWWQKIEMINNAFFVQGRGPEVDDNKLFVLDTEGTLHFFKET